MVFYEQTAEERRILLEKAQRRAVLRAEYLKQLTNPHAHGHGGTVFDPQLQRFQAMRISHYEHFKPTGKSLKTFLAFAVPMFAYVMWIKTDRDRREQEYRTGQVAYKDRRFKFI